MTTVSGFQLLEGKKKQQANKPKKKPTHNPKHRSFSDSIAYFCIDSSFWIRAIPLALPLNKGIRYAIVWPFLLIITALRSLQHRKALPQPLHIPLLGQLCNIPVEEKHCGQNSFKVGNHKNFTQEPLYKPSLCPPSSFISMEVSSSQASRSHLLYHR